MNQTSHAALIHSGPKSFSVYALNVGFSVIIRIVWLVNKILMAIVRSVYDSNLILFEPAQLIGESKRAVDI